MTSLIDLAPGTALRINGVEWTAEEVLPQVGQVVLSGCDGERQTRSIRWLIHHPDCRPAKLGHPSGRREAVQQPVTTGDLTEVQVKRARLRAAHVLEAETGYRSGHPSRALPGEPRLAYDPDKTTVTERRRAKAAELAALGREEAELLGLANMSVRTLERCPLDPADEEVPTTDGRPQPPQPSGPRRPHTA